MGSVEQRVSLRDIAKKAGVSQSTVSRALRNDARISETIRERVRTIAQRIGYRPDPLVAKLMAQMRAAREARFECLLGFLLPQEDYPPGYYREMLTGARERAKSLGYLVDEFKTSLGKKDVVTLNRVLMARGAEGILILPRLKPEPPPVGLNVKHFAIVSCALFTSDFPVHQVSPDHFGNMMHILQKIRAMGLKRPALVSWEDFDRRQHWAPRMTYYFYYHDVVGKPPPPIFDWHKYSGDLAAPFMAWFHKVTPDVLLVVGPVIADAVTGILRRAGVRKIPPIFGVGHMPPGYRGINEKPANIGSAAVDILTSHIVRNEKGWPADVKLMTLEGSLR